MPFSIRVAKTAGFCFGVQRALDLVLELVNAANQPVHTLGPLIHNEQVLEILRARGIQEMASNDREFHEGHVVIRAHGIAPHLQKQLKQLNFQVCNATCPKVGRVQGIVKKFANLGYQIVIVGDRGHAEVDGLLGYAGDWGVVVAGPEEVDKIDLRQKICVVAQTTQSHAVFQETVDRLKQKAEDVQVFDTICLATTERQQETIRLAQKSDLMIVVGGVHSANTKRLVEISSRVCRTVLIQSAGDLSPELLNNVRNIGVTAGASTPSWIIRNVVERLKEMDWAKSGLAFRYLRRIMRFLHETHLLASFGAAFITSAIDYFFTKSAPSFHPLYSFWLVQLLASANLLSRNAEHISQIYPDASHIQKFRKTWIILNALLTLAVLITALIDSFKLVIITIVLAYLALTYSYPLLRLPLQKGWRRIKDLPFIKDFVIAILVAFVLVLLPWHHHQAKTLSMILVFFYTICLVWVRAIMFDIRDLQSDLIAGVSSLPLCIGKEKVKYLLGVVLILWVLLPVLMYGLSLTDWRGLLLSFVPAYYSVYLYLYHNRIIFLSLTSDLAIDAGIWITGICFILNKL